MDTTAQALKSVILAILVFNQSATDCYTIPLAVIKKMRKRISTKTRNWKYVPIVIGILLIGMIIKILTENKNDTLAVGILTLFVLLLTGLYFVFDKAKSIEFDNEYLFISSKKSNEKISFKNIRKIKKTLAEINGLAIKNWTLS